jgi:nicotinamidase-related amidase
MNIPRADPSEILILMIDVQPSFLKYAHFDQEGDQDSLIVRLEHLLMLSDSMNMPVIATFEIPISGNGELPERLDSLFPETGQRFEKNSFGCMAEADINHAIQATRVKQIAVAGAETDVCVLQSVLGLLEANYQVFLLEDCLFTSEPHPGPALRRMYQAGAIPSTLKTLSYELVKCVNEVPWYPEAWAMKDRSESNKFPDNYQPPEAWPNWNPKLE